MLKDEHIEDFIVKNIKSGDTVSIGTSKLGTVFLKKLALAIEREEIDLKGISFVPTSNELAEVASQLKLPITNLNDSEIDVAVEFVSAVDWDFNFIKRESFSLVRDKMIAQSAATLFVVCEEENFSKTLRGKIPFEVAPFGWKRTLNQLSMFGNAKLVEDNGKPQKTESGNYLIEVVFDEVFFLEDLEYKTKDIPGVLETGLFLGYADKILLHNNNRIKMISRTSFEKKVRV